jgi:pectate lyase
MPLRLQGWTDQTAVAAHFAWFHARTPMMNSRPTLIPWTVGLVCALGSCGDNESDGAVAAPAISSAAPSAGTSSLPPAPQAGTPTDSTPQIPTTQDATTGSVVTPGSEVPIDQSADPQPDTPLPTATETDTPTTDTPTTDTPTTDTPATDAPTTDAADTGAPNAADQNGGTTAEPETPEQGASDQQMPEPDMPTPDQQVPDQEMPDPQMAEPDMPEPDMPDPEPETSGDPCAAPPAAGPLIGWAGEAGGTTGGGDADPITVSDAAGLVAAISGDEPRVVIVDGVISSNSRFDFGSNKTVAGVCGAEIHGAINISNVNNIILRNIKMVGFDCSDSPGNCSAGSDVIGVRDGSHHLWFDHLDASDGSDGNLYMTRAADYITISYTRFYYSTRRTDPEQGASGHRFSNLIAGSDSDAGEYRITFHHNWWAENVDQRMPRSPFGQIHVFNNLFTSSGNSYCTNAGFDAEVLVENKLYRDVNQPLSPDNNGACVQSETSSRGPPETPTAMVAVSSHRRTPTTWTTRTPSMHSWIRLDHNSSPS